MRYMWQRFSVNANFAVHQRIHTGENLRNIRIVTNHLGRVIHNIIRQFRQERNHLNMMYMAGALLEMTNLEPIGEFTLERNIRNVIVVRNILVQML